MISIQTQKHLQMGVAMQNGKYELEAGAITYTAVYDHEARMWTVCHQDKGNKSGMSYYFPDTLSVVKHMQIIAPLSNWEYHRFDIPLPNWKQNNLD